MQPVSRIVIAIAICLLLPFSALAAAQRPFDEQAFNAAQAAGTPVLIEVHADWCPTCKAQLPILDKLSGTSDFAGIVRLRVDFDSQKNLVKRFGARMQSTLVLYKGGKEVARSVGETNEGRLRAMLAKAR